MSVSQSTDDFRRELKARTQELHSQLESLPTFARLATGELSRPEYVAVLEKYFGFYGPFESNADRLPSAVAHLDYEARRKVPWLVADLNYFGRSEESLARLPRFDWGTATPAFALGQLYVVEGSTLGNQIIARAVQKNLNLTSDAGAAFFTGYGAETAPRWREFIAELTRYATAETFPEILEGAQFTFRAIYRWMK